MPAPFALRQLGNIEGGRDDRLPPLKENMIRDAEPSIGSYRRTCVPAKVRSPYVTPSRAGDFVLRRFIYVDGGKHGLKREFDRIV